MNYEKFVSKTLEKLCEGDSDINRISQSDLDKIFDCLHQVRINLIKDYPILTQEQRDIYTFQLKELGELCNSISYKKIRPGMDETLRKISKELKKQH